MVADLNNIEDRAAVLRTSLAGNAARACCIERKLTPLEAGDAEKIQDATRCVAASQCSYLNALQQEVTVLKQARKGSEAKVRCFTKKPCTERGKAFRLHEPAVSDDHREVRSLR